MTSALLRVAPATTGLGTVRCRFYRLVRAASARTGAVVVLLITKDAPCSAAFTHIIARKRVNGDGGDVAIQRHATAGATGFPGLIADRRADGVAAVA